MRVVSQDGRIDIPYNSTYLRVVNNNIVTCLMGDSGRGTAIMATYSTSEKAQKAMELLHGEHVGIVPSLIIDKGANLGSESMEVLTKSRVGAIVRTDRSADVEVHMLPRIFRFPDDDKIDCHESQWKVGGEISN